MPNTAIQKSQLSKPMSNYSKEEPPRILVTIASKHGSTEEIGKVIGQRLQDQGFVIEIRSIKEAPDPSPYAAVVVGSAVYAGSWMKPAHMYILRNAPQLANRPIWLFSSGPIGTHPEPQKQEIMHMNEYIQRTKCVEHKVFNGSIAAEKLSLAEKLVVKALKVEYGDYRDWKVINSWAQSIARHLQNAHT